MKEQFKRFAKIFPGLLERISLTRDIQIRTERNIPVPFPFNNGGKLCLHGFLRQNQKAVVVPSHLHSAEYARTLFRPTLAYREGKVDGIPAEEVFGEF